ncbi:MAG TPA: GH92 family glycosyl hydrolase [bacterium]|nr:GH92 family glycosyl hydrolase [bacterium]
MGKKNLASRSLALLLNVLVIVPACLLAAPAPVCDRVDPFIGTANGGNTFPGALVPWGMVSVSPHNDPQAPSGYVQGRPFLYGFGQLHLSGTGCPDLGNVLLTANVGPVRPGASNWGTAYGGEMASPGYYSVLLKDSGIQVQATATERVGLLLFSFPARKGDANILLDAGHRLTTDPVTLKSPTFESSVKVVSPTLVEGYSESGDFCSVYSGNKQRIYFCVQFSKAAQSFETWSGERMGGDQERTGPSTGAVFHFSTAAQEPVLAKVGISFVSVENAELNLQTECPGWDFEGVRAQARQKWEKELSEFQITGGTPRQLRIFYTALYHSLIHPSLFSDVNGQYPSMGHKGVKVADGYNRYHIFSLWDTYRNLHPFLGLFYPTRALDMVKSLVAMQQESGWLPKWELAGNETSVMVGCPAVPVILDAFRQGLKRFDQDAAYQAMAKSLDPEGNKTYGGLRSLLKFGYIPKDDDSGDWIWGSVSTGLEYSYAYWCLAQMAKDLGHDEDSKGYMVLSGDYRNYYNPATGFLQARKRDGSWIAPFDPQASCCDQSWPGNGGPGYVEGTAWQYLFYAPQDLDGLQMLLGGPEAFVARLQECFEKGHYDAANEPDLSWPYLFDSVPGEAWRTQQQVRALMESSYKDTPDGIPGNDDCGTMSAWYLFSALGFYPVCPGSDRYFLGSPLFQQVDIHLNNRVYPGARLVLKTINGSPRNVYVHSVRKDGMEYKKSWIGHEDLVYGRTLVFQMTGEPPHGLLAPPTPGPTP